MLRPATPLTLLLFASFVLLLISVISTPIVEGIPLSTFNGLNFGVFGYCTPQECSKVVIGYNTDGLFGDADNDPKFSLPSTARHSLSALLVVHPIAALFNLICLGLAGAAHLHSPSHSARYLLGLLILLLPTLLVTLLAFLVDILLFVPYLQWGGWIVLASTILITASGVVTCAMRRTLVSRKARKRRIAENAEMSGESFYSRQNAQQMIDAASSRTTGAPHAPHVNGTLGADTLPASATFTKEHDVFEGRSELSRRSGSNGMDGSALGYGSAYKEGLGPVRSRSREQYMGSRDEYGNPIPSYASGVAGPRRDPSDPGLWPANSRERTNGLPPGVRGGPGYGPPRGRGGYPPRGAYGPRRGFGVARGDSNQGFGRAGDNDGRGIYDWRGRGGAVAAGVGAGMAAGYVMTRNQPGSPPGYPPQGPMEPLEGDGSREDPRRNSWQSYGVAPGAQPLSSGAQPLSSGGSIRGPTPGMAPALPPNGPIMGQAVAMNASTGRVTRTTGRPENGEAMRGMVVVPPNLAGDHYSPSSEYSSPDAPARPPNLSPPVGLASHGSSMYSNGPDSYMPARARSSDYYEDIDPRFSDGHMTDLPNTLPDQQQPWPPLPLPRSLTPGAPLSRSLPAFPPDPPPHLDHLVPHAGDPPSGSGSTPSDEQLRDGTLSRTGSEVSHFTSVSQGGVNPSGKAGVGGPDGRSMPAMGWDGAGVGVAGSRTRDVRWQNHPALEVPQRVE